MQELLRLVENDMSESDMVTEWPCQLSIEWGSQCSLPVEWRILRIDVALSPREVSSAAPSVLPLLRVLSLHPLRRCHGV